MSEFIITELNRGSLPLKIYMRGLSGSGKTFGALTLARGICPTGKIGVIDTLGGQANQYGGYPQFGTVKCLPMSPPYSADRCIAAIDAAVADGWEVIIFDTLSAHHDGEGGQLERADEEEGRGVAGMGKWNKPKMETRRLMNHIVGLERHFIGTYLMAETTDMKTKTSKISPIQTKGSESYFTFHVEVTNVIDNKGEFHPARWLRIPQNFQGCIAQDAEITSEVGRLLAGESAGGGKPATEKSAAKAPAPVNDDAREGHLQDIGDYLDSEGISADDFNLAITATYSKSKTKYTDYKKLPSDHLKVLSKADRLAAMADKAREIANGGQA